MNDATDIYNELCFYTLAHGDPSFIHQHVCTSSCAAWIGATPERAAIVLFVASAASELSQRWWLRGFFAGHFDPFDIAAYAIGIGVCHAFDASVIPSRRSPV